MSSFIFLKELLPSSYHPKSQSLTYPALICSYYVQSKKARGDDSLSLSAWADECLDLRCQSSNWSAMDHLLTLSITSSDPRRRITHKVATAKNGATNSCTGNGLSNGLSHDRGDEYLRSNVSGSKSSLENGQTAKLDSRLGSSSLLTGRSLKIDLAGGQKNINDDRPKFEVSNGQRNDADSLLIETHRCNQVDVSYSNLESVSGNSNSSVPLRCETSALPFSRHSSDAGELCLPVEVKVWLQRCLRTRCQAFHSGRIPFVKHRSDVVGWSLTAEYLWWSICELSSVLTPRPLAVTSVQGQRSSILWALTSLLSGEYVIPRVSDWRDRNDSVLKDGTDLHRVEDIVCSLCFMLQSLFTAKDGTIEELNSLYLFAVRKLTPIAETEEPLWSPIALSMLMLIAYARKRMTPYSSTSALEISEEYVHRMAQELWCRFPTFSPTSAAQVLLIARVMRQRKVSIFLSTKPAAVPNLVTSSSVLSKRSSLELSPHTDTVIASNIDLLRALPTHAQIALSLLIITRRCLHLEGAWELPFLTNTTLRAPSMSYLNTGAIAWLGDRWASPSAADTSSIRNYLRSRVDDLDKLCILTYSDKLGRKGSFTKRPSVSLPISVTSSSSDDDRNAKCTILEAFTSWRAMLTAHLTLAPQDLPLFFTVLVAKHEVEIKRLINQHHSGGSSAHPGDSASTQRAKRLTIWSQPALQDAFCDAFAPLDAIFADANHTNPDSVGGNPLQSKRISCDKGADYIGPPDCEKPADFDDTIDKGRATENGRTTDNGRATDNWRATDNGRVNDNGRVTDNGRATECGKARFGGALKPSYVYRLFALLWTCVRGRHLAANTWGRSRYSDTVFNDSLISSQDRLKSSALRLRDIPRKLQHYRQMTNPTAGKSKLVTITKKMKIHLLNLVRAGLKPLSTNKWSSLPQCQDLRISALLFPAFKTRMCRSVWRGFFKSYGRLLPPKEERFLEDKVNARLAGFVRLAKITDPEVLILLVLTRFLMDDKIVKSPLAFLTCTAIQWDCFHRGVLESSLQVVKYILETCISIFQWSCEWETRRYMSEEYLQMQAMLMEGNLNLSGSACAKDLQDLWKQYVMEIASEFPEVFSLCGADQQSAIFHKVGEGSGASVAGLFFGLSEFARRHNNVDRHLEIPFTRLLSQRLDSTPDTISHHWSEDDVSSSNFWHHSRKHLQSPPSVVHDRNPWARFSNVLTSPKDPLFSLLLPLLYIHANPTNALTGLDWQRDCITFRQFLTLTRPFQRATNSLHDLADLIKFLKRFTPLLLQLWTHPSAIPAARWLLTALDAYISPILAKGTPLRPANLLWPSGPIAPVISFGIVEYGLKGSARHTMDLPNNDVQYLKLVAILIRCLKPFLSSLLQRLRAYRHKEEDIDILKMLARRLQMRLLSDGTEFDAESACLDSGSPLDARLTQTFVPSALTGSLGTVSTLTEIVEPVCAMERMIFQLRAFQCLSDASNLVDYGDRERIQREGLLVHKGTQAISAASKYNFIKALPEAVMLSGTRQVDSLENDLSTSTQSILVKEVRTAALARLVLQIARCCRLLVHQKYRLSDEVTSSPFKELSNTDKRCPIQGFWKACEKHRDWLASIMTDILWVVNLLNSVMVTKMPGKINRHRKSFLLGVLAQFIHSSRPLFLEVNAPTVSVSVRKWRRKLRGVYRKVIDKLPVNKTQDRWLRYIQRHTSVDAAYFDDDLKELVERYRQGKRPKGPIYWISGLPIEGATSTKSLPKHTKGFEVHSLNRVFLLWMLLISTRQSSSAAAETAMFASDLIQLEFSVGKKLVGSQAQRGVLKLFKMRRGLGLNHEQRLWRPLDLLVVPCVSFSKYLRKLYSSLSPLDSPPHSVLTLQTHFARSIDQLSLEDVSFFVSQILVAARCDHWSMIEHQMACRAVRDVNFAKLMLSSMSSEIATLATMQKYDDKKGISYNAQLFTIGRVRERLGAIVASLPDSKKVIEEVTFYDSLIDLSARAARIQMPRRTEFVKTEVAKICADHDFAMADDKTSLNDFAPSTTFDALFGTDKFMGAWPDRSKALKSAAKAPYMVEFVAAAAATGARVPQSVIFKMNDDLRTDQLALQMIRLVYTIASMAGLPLWLCPYGVLSAFRQGAFGGAIEMVRNTRSRHEIGKDLGLTLGEFFRTGLPEGTDYPTAQWNFLKSLAGYSIISFVLQFKDRHNANMLIDDDGHILHIDFGFILDHSPAGDLRFERAPFKLTREMIYLINSIQEDSLNHTDSSLTSGQGFLLLRHLIVDGYMALRQKHQLLLDMLRFFSLSGLTCFKVKTFRNVSRRLQLGQSDEVARAFINDQIDAAVNALSTRIYDAVQALQQGIAY